MKSLTDTCLKIMLAVLVALSVTACNEARDPNALTPEERGSALSAANTTHVVATDPALADSLPAHASILLDQVHKIWVSLMATAEERQAAASSAAELASLGEAAQRAAPAVTAQQLENDPEEAAARSTADRENRNQTIKEAREAGRVWGFLAGLGTLLATTILPRVLTSLGIPGGGLLAAGVEWLAGNRSKKKAQELDHRASTAATAVVSSALGKLALRELDKRLPQNSRDEVGAVVAALTGGEAETIEGLFKFVAKGNNVDQRREREVSALLKELRDLTDTEGGLPEALKKLLKAV